MKSKIEKLKRIEWFTVEDRIVSFDYILEMSKKLNKIIDHLNSQDQEEEKYSRDYAPLVVHPEVYKSLEETGCNMENYIKTELAEVEDTPEEWREVNKDTWYVIGGKKYANIGGEKYIRISDLQQLLEEREKEVVERIKIIVSRPYLPEYINKDDLVEIILDKLNTKKK